MPIRRSEAYDDPLKQKSHEKLPVPGKISEAKSVSLQEPGIQWSNLIFLPFHPIFEMFIVFGVCIKVVLGPIQAVYPIVYCSELMEKHSSLTFIKYFYLYFCDSLYGIDTFLHIVHRQVTDKAMRRQHLPKSAGLLLIDLISLIPMFRMATESCPPIRLWPNILAFNEYLVIYRIGLYFSLITTHSYKNLLSGYTIVLLMTLNCVTCFWLLLTAEGLCENCNIPGKYYDWRDFIKHKLNETDEGYGTYIYAFSFVFSFTENSFYSDEIVPTTMVEFYICCLFAIICYISKHFLLTPKFFGEALIRLRWICTRYPVTQKIIEETKRRNASKNAHKKVEEYYVTMWRKQKGIYRMPSIYKQELPRYLRLEIKQDLLWPIFYHSPTLRKTSLAMRRWLSDFIIISYKMPGERFFTGADSSGTLYYLKSGIVELLSTDDGTTPILSVTSGTIFGDTNFYTPNNNRKVITRCLTFCEIYYVKRSLFIRALHRYPSDRNVIMRTTRARLEHAKKLYSCKALIRGIDRNEDEGIAWIKRRWWEIHDVVQKWSRQSGKTKEQVRCDLPREESIYHCAKYIGQLVLCAPSELQTQSMFTRYSFPWILNPISNFGHAWYRIVAITVLLVLCTFPTNLVKAELPVWFVYFTFYSDTVYILDIGVSLFTAVDKLEMSTDSFATVMFERFKTFTFLLDVISTLWFEDIFSIAGTSEAMYNTLQFNRLLKCYVLFRGVYLNWDLIIKNPFVDLCRKLILTYFTIQMVCSHVILDMTNYMKLNMRYFFGEIMCIRTVKSDCHAIHPVVGVLVAWEFEWVFCEFSPENLPDMYVGMFVTFMNFVLFIFNKGNFVSYMYLKYRSAKNYQIFVSNLKKYYEHYKIHLDLLKRLDRYFICHWKYYQGADVMFSNSLEHEPTEVYWKAQGEVAQTVIGESGAFTHADPALIRELACEAKFLVLPKLTNLVMFGIPCKNVTWIVQGYVKSEHYDETGELLITYYGPGNMLAISSVFFGRVSLSTYSTYTDCEAIFIPIHRFFEIYKRYKIEYEFLQVCTTEFGRQFDEMFKKCILKHRDYQHKLRDRIYSTRMSMVATSKVMPDIQEQRSLPFEGELWGDPESRFMQSWLTFRCIIVYVSIASAAVLGGVGAVSRWVFTMISGFCDCISWIDIIMKLCMPYYDNRGIKITDRQKCFLNYASKAFVLDVIGAVPWFDVIKSILESEIDDDTSFLMNTLCKFAHIYIIFAYFQYISDIPTVNGTFINIIKWQLVNSLVVLGASHYFMVSCVKFDFESKSMRLLEVTLRNTCWMPDVIQLPIDLSWDDLHLIFAESLSLAENGMMGLHFGRFLIDRENIGVGICLMFIGILYWFISAYSLTLLVLDVGGHYEFQHSVNQLESFLKSERVNKAIIERSVLHFKYCWKRTMAVELAQLNNESINTVFRQDLNSYFYRKTFSILDSIFKGGEQMQRQLASNSIIHFFLPGHDIFREQDMINFLCVVHRGRVALSKNGQKLITLSKGDIFGQLLGTKVRPVRVTATAEDFVDVLYIDLKAFQSTITEPAIFIPIHRFFEIYKRYKIEYEFLQVCTTEFGRQFDEMFKKCILKHRDYQHKLRDRIYSTRMSMVATSKVMPDIQEQRSLPFEGELWGDPESRFMQSWLTFRCIIVYVSIASAAVLGGVGAVSRWVFTMISGFCDCISWIDIIMKLCMPYYDNRGIKITDRQKCFLNYASKAFVLDVIGAVPWFDVIKSILESEIDDDTSFLMNTLCKFAHIYIIFAYFQYISDIPTVNGTFINIIKWQLVNSLVVLGASHYFMVSCVKFDFESKSMRLLEVTLRNTCWMPDVIQLPIDLSWDDLHLIFAESLSLAENGMMGLHFGRFLIDRENIGVGICLMFIGILYWFISAYSLTLLVLDVGGHYEFQHSVNQLESFLKSERVNKAIIERSVLHFKYCWKRTMAVELAQLNNESINTVFRQDLNSYFYRKTFSILDSIFKGGEQMQRQLASNSIIHFFLPGHDIFREQDMINFLCVVHRGRVALSKNGQKLITLSKGDIFGQLLGTKVRPVRVTATAEDFVDVLYIDLKAFQSTITEPVRRTITRNPQQKSDFMATKNIFVENPYDTVQYLLRGRKTIRLPWSRYPTEARGANWYVYFLHLTWFVGPLVTAMIVHTLFVLPTGHNLWVRMYVLLFIFDAVHLINFLSEFYEIELVVLKNKCAHQRVGLKIFKRWGLYVDLLTFLIPLGTIVNNDWRFQYGRILRLKSFWDFHRNFCKSFKRQLTPVILKISIILLIMHSFTCGWVYIACRREGKFPVRLLDVRNFSNIIDLSMWMHPDDRGEGCARVSRDIPAGDDPDESIPTFVVPRHWAHDYVLAFTYILMTQTLTNLDTVMPLTINEVYYKVFMTFVLQLVDLYVLAMALNFARTKYRELYLYDEAVKKMLIYLSNCGLCKSLSDSILAYTHQLWDRQKGERLPDLAYKAPTSLRHDLFSELYIHHLEAPATFRQLPYFFKRQLAARLNRMTVFPGKCIVREGDTFNVTYFIHEGEVEKWYSDKNGESKLVSVLYTNGYFGCVSGLFINVGFYFSYYSRTVVDLVYLSLDNWKDLLECYPEVKMMLYESTKKFRSEVTKAHPSRSPTSSTIY